MGGTMAAQDVWKERLERWAKSGVGAEQFAVREGVKPAALKWWRWRLGGEDRKKGPEPTAVATASPTPPQRVGARPVFVEVEAASTPAPTESARYEVVLGNGRVVRVPVGFSDGELARVLVIAESAR